MGDDPDPGGGISLANPATTSALPATSMWAEGKKSTDNVRLRTFEEIIHDATNNRNILKIKLQKNVNESDSSVKPPNLSYDQLGELLFDHLKIKIDDCLRFNFNTSRYDSREVMLKPGLDLEPFITIIDDFYGHTVTTSKQSASKSVRVSFRNVPLDVPDEEILHLCSYYGKPDTNSVEYEKISFSKMTKISSGSTRFVDMELIPGKRFSNYYWMEGPLPGDQGCRITVLHSGQDRQCSHCLRTQSEGCLGHGQGKVCKELGTKMTRMADYMSEVRTKIGYESLKTQYLKKYPVLGNQSGKSVLAPPNEEIDEHEENSDVFDESELSKMKEKVISMEKEYEDSKKCLEQRLHQTKRNSNLARNKISTATECLDFFLADYLNNNDIDEFNPSFKFLVSQYSSLLFTPECYTVNTENCQVVLSESLFSNLVRSNSEISDKIKYFKNHLTDKLSLDYSVRRERRLSTGSFRSRLPSASTKRSNDELKGNPSKCSRPSQS